MKTKTVKELRAEAKALGVPRYSKMRKAELLEAIAAHRDYDPAANSAKSYALAINVMRNKLASFRQERIGDCWLIQGDCREVLPLLPKVDAVITDPPYGIGRDKGNETRCGSGFYPVQLRKQYADDWDYRPDRDVLMAVVGAARYVVVWGGNFFTSSLPENGHWLVWDKQNTMPTFSDCELAWTNLPKNSVKVIRYSNNGLLAKEKNRVHPTQKPVSVMQWCIEQLPATCRTILDPYVGSGTTGVACVKLGRRFIGIEIEPKYFDIACRRIEEAYKQPDFFVQPTTPKYEQLALQVA